MKYTTACSFTSIFLISSIAFANPSMVQKQLSSSKALPSGHAPVANQQPSVQPKPEMVPVSGKVLQTIKSGGYTYVLLKKNKGKKVWVAIPEMNITVGEQMGFEPGMEMKNFPSTSLKRTFDAIIFSNGPVADNKKGSSKKVEEKKGTRGSAGAVVAVSDEKVKVKKAKGANAYTVSEVFKNKSKLNGKKVVIRGKVVKASSGIMNRNWIHIQDGTGSHQTGDNDLVITSDAIPSVGDVVTVKGTMQKDKDFGSNYKYNVIIEKAQIEIE